MLAEEIVSRSGFSSPDEGNVSICHINKVNPSPNRKPFPTVLPPGSARPQKILAREEGLPPRFTVEKLTHEIPGRKSGGERKDRIDETSN